MSQGLGRRLFQARHALSAQLGYAVTQTAVAKALGTTRNAVAGKVGRLGLRRKAAAAAVEAAA